MRTNLVLDPLEQAPNGRVISGTTRPPLRPRVANLDMRYTGRLGEARLAPSAGSTGGSHDNALDQVVWRTEMIHHRSLDDVNMLRWSSSGWFNTQRLMKSSGRRVPPAEYAE